MKKTEYEIEELKKFFRILKSNNISEYEIKNINLPLSRKKDIQKEYEQIQHNKILLAKYLLEFNKFTIRWIARHCKLEEKQVELIKNELINFYKEQKELEGKIKYLTTDNELKESYKNNKIRLCQNYDCNYLLELISKLVSQMEEKRYSSEFYIFPDPDYSRNFYFMCLRDISVITDDELYNYLRENGYTKIDPNYIRLANIVVDFPYYYGSLFGNNWSRADVVPDFLRQINCSVNGGHNSYQEELFLNITDPHYFYIIDFLNYIANWKLCNNKFNDNENWKIYEEQIEPFIEEYKAQKRLVLPVEKRVCSI